MILIILYDIYIILKIFVKSLQQMLIVCPLHKN